MKKVKNATLDDSAVSRKMKKYKNKSFSALSNRTRLFFRNGGSNYLLLLGKCQSDRTFKIWFINCRWFINFVSLKQQDYFILCALMYAKHVWPRIEQTDWNKSERIEICVYFSNEVDNYDTNWISVIIFKINGEGR